MTDIVGDGAGVATIDDGGKTLVARAVDHRDPRRLKSLERLVGWRAPTSEGWAGHVLASGRSVRLPIASHRPLAGIGPALAAVLAELSGALLAPVRARGAVIGLAVALRDRGHARYSLREQVVVERLAACPGAGADEIRGRDVATGRAPAGDGDLVAQLRDRSDAAVWATDLDGRTLAMTPAMGELLGQPFQSAAGLPIADFLEPPPAFVVGAVLDEPERAEHRLHRADGKTLWVATISRPLLDRRGVRRGTLVTVADVTDSKRAQVALRLQLDAAKGLARVLTGVLRGDDPGELLAWAVDAAADILSVRRVGVFERRDDGSLRLRAGSGWPPELVGRYRAATLGSPAGLALTSAEPVVVADARELPSGSLEDGMRSGCWVGIGAGRGVFAALHDEPRDFDRDERDFLASLAEAVSGCLGSARQRRPLASEGRG